MRHRRSCPCNFNSRPSARGDAADVHAGSGKAADFNSRPSARGDAGDLEAVHKLTEFQFTPLREGRPNGQKRPAAARIFQFTPLREGRLHPDAEILRKPQISIHAPPRGATARRGCARKPRTNFNSRPSARGDLSRAKRKPRPPNFNSRPSARGDDFRGARCGVLAHFNSRPSARGDTICGGTLLMINQFQFTPLREGRPNGCSQSVTMGSISIHAPPRGAT